MNAPQPAAQCELVAPAGNWDCLRAAVANGADAVYFGLSGFNARMRAENFREEDLPEIMQFLHAHGVKGYVTMNVLIFTDELAAAARQLKILSDNNVDAVIVQDIGLALMAHRMFPHLRIHASTQMTITSPEGVEFAETIGVRQVVLARELSLRELAKFPQKLPLEVFVHGALCVAYSGQCLTSESLGQRSANRGECAQACRMPYELVVDGAPVDLGDKRYLLSPQDLAAANQIPELARVGVRSFKIEGRLKSPEYVAAVTAAYRKAIDQLQAEESSSPNPRDWYALEMTFSRGLYSGWLNGVNHQELVGARFGKKRGVLLGMVQRVGRDYVELDQSVRAKPGDGIVFDIGGDTNNEQGGRIARTDKKRLYFHGNRLRLDQTLVGARVWKTHDPELEKRLRGSFAGRLLANQRGLVSLSFTISGKAGEPMRIIASAKGKSIKLQSRQSLITARTKPLTSESLRNQFGRLEGTPFRLGTLENQLEGDVLLPFSELNNLRRSAASQLGDQLFSTAPEPTLSLSTLLEEASPRTESAAVSRPDPRLTILCRSTEQIQAALDCGVQTIYIDFEDIRRYPDAIQLIRNHPQLETFSSENSTLGTPLAFLATPRIQKAGEHGFFKLIENAQPDGVLARNIGAITYFRKTTLPMIGDFSLNVANPLTAALFVREGLKRVTISYDLNVPQVLELAQAFSGNNLELTIHQHMPMFHMEHCVFAAFMSKGTDYTNCGRPCERHRVELKDRVGMTHPLRADVGCRNTLFNAVAQSGARFFEPLQASGINWFRIELLNEDYEQAKQVIKAYQALLLGRNDGLELWRKLNARNQLGVTSGTLSKR